MIFSAFGNTCNTDPVTGAMDCGTPYGPPSVTTRCGAPGTRCGVVVPLPELPILPQICPPACGIGTVTPVVSDPDPVAAVVPKVSNRFVLGAGAVGFALAYFLFGRAR